MLPAQLTSTIVQLLSKAHEKCFNDALVSPVYIENLIACKMVCMGEQGDNRKRNGEGERMSGPHVIEGSPLHSLSAPDALLNNPSSTLPWRAILPMMH
jgi:hypothetical protein